MVKGSLTLCGFGMDLNQLTLETAEALMNAEVIFSDAIEERETKVVRKYCSDVRDLKALAGGGAARDVAPRKIEFVLDAVAQGKRVALLNFGHPTFLSSLAQGLIDACRQRGFPCRVLNAVSSLDAVLSSLELTGLWNGLHIYDADDYSGLITVVPLNPSVPTVIVKVGYLLKAEQRSRLDLFVARLCEFYPAGHPAVLVESPWISNKAGTRVETTIEALGSAIEDPNEFLTLYLPPKGGAYRTVVTDADAESGMASDLEEGRRLVDAGALDKAEAHFSKLLRKAPDRVEALAWRARVLITGERCEEALVDLDAAVARMPEPGWPHSLRAEVRLRTGDFKGCLEDAQRACLWKDHGVEAEMLLASAQIRLGQLEAADAVMNKAVTEWGVDSALGIFLGFNEDVPLQNQAAVWEYALARLEEREDREWLSVVLGSWAQEDRKFDDAVRLLERALRAYPDAQFPKRRLELSRSGMTSE